MNQARYLFHNSDSGRFHFKQMGMWLDASLAASYSGSGSLWNDLSGKNTNANLNGPAFSTGEFSFDGIDDYALVTDRTFSISNGITLGGWFKKVAGTGQTLIGVGESSVLDKYFHIYIDANGFLCGVKRKAASPITVTSAQVIANDVYFSCYVVFRATDVAIYYNGELIFSQTVTSVSLDTTFNDILIGVARLNSPFGWFNGKIGEAYVYDKELLPHQIKINHLLTKSRYGL